MFLFFFSVGKAEVPEGSGTVAARHRGKSTFMDLNILENIADIE